MEESDNLGFDNLVYQFSEDFSIDKSKKQNELLKQAGLQQSLNPQFQLTIKRYESSNNLALYNHDKQDLPTFIKRFSESCHIYRYPDKQNFKLQIIPEQQAKYGSFDLQNSELLMTIKLMQSQIQQSKKFFHIFPQPITEIQQIQRDRRKCEKKIFKSIRNKKNSTKIGHRLEKIDEIRFGLQNFRVLQLQSKWLPQRKNKAQNHQHQSYDQIISIPLQNIIPKQALCKFCLNEQSGVPQNPLLEPCRCKGTCQYVHLQCLKIWINKFLHKKEDQKLDVYNWTKFECEICKTKYPLKVKYQDKVIKLIDYQVPYRPYIILERVKQGQRKKIFVIKAFNEPVSIGRVEENDIKIDGNTVSRYHSCIEYKNGQFYLRDLGSKFGTLVRLKDNFRIKGKMKFQVGDLLMRFDLVVKKDGKEYVWKFD